MLLFILEHFWGFFNYSFFVCLFLVFCGVLNAPFPKSFILLLADCGIKLEMTNKLHFQFWPLKISKHSQKCCVNVPFFCSKVIIMVWAKCTVFIMTSTIDTGQSHGNLSSVSAGHVVLEEWLMGKPTHFIKKLKNRLHMK